MRKPDPFDWPMPNRSDLMSAKCLNSSYDNMHMKTHHMRVKTRQTSTNLLTGDIDGKKRNGNLDILLNGFFL